jgi:hypothetical protein
LLLALAGSFAGCGGLTKSHTEFRVGPATRVTITPQNTTLQLGKSQRFSALARDKQGQEVSDATFVWSTFAGDVATVDAEGVVTAVAPGMTSVTAAHNGMLGSAQVTVVAEAVETTFARDIKPLATMACSCHQSGSAAAATGPMNDLANITARGYLVSGNAQGSTYLTTGAGGAGHPGGNAWGAQQERVREWIEQGAKP